ncbi:MAG: hypothetical protein GKC10_04030 [Methanosarcinales archaeon]|nr:hypothetical protein [Methanosarcinales archaeon]
MKPSICPRCGQPSDEGLCERCLLQSTEIMSCPPQVEITVCSVCGSVSREGHWQAEDVTLEDLINEALHREVRVHADLKKPVLSVDLSSRGDTIYVAEVTVRGLFKGIEAEDSCQVRVKILRHSCDRCSRIAGKYFEGLVQVRGSDRIPEKAELEMAREMALSMADSTFKRGDTFAFIQEIKDVRGGVDIIVGSTTLGRQIAKALQQRFGGRLLESRKLVGCKDGRDVYRTTFLVRLPRLCRGDVIWARGDIWEVVGFDVKRTYLNSLRTGARSTLSDDDAEQAEILGSRDGAKSSVVVARDDKVVEILDPQSFETVAAIRPLHHDPEPGQEVLVLKTDRGYVLLR